MSYIAAIMESEDVKNLTASSEHEINQLVSDNFDRYRNITFEYVTENLQYFLGQDVQETYNNILEFVSNDISNMISAISEAAALDKSYDHVHAILQENVSSVFAGVGFGTQKAQRLITSIYY